MTKKKILTPANVELTQAIVKAHAPGKNRNRPPLEKRFDIPTKPYAFHQRSDKEMKRAKTKVSLPQIKFPKDK